MRLRHITMTIECGIKTIIQSHNPPPHKKKKCNDLKTSHAAVCVCCGQEKIISLTSSSSCSCPSSYPVSSSFWQLQPCFSFSCQLQPSSWQRPPSSSWQPQPFSYRRSPSSSWQRQPFVVFSFQRRPFSWQHWQPLLAFSFRSCSVASFFWVSSSQIRPTIFFVVFCVSDEPPFGCLTIVVHRLFFPLLVQTVNVHGPLSFFKLLTPAHLARHALLYVFPSEPHTCLSSFVHLHAAAVVFLSSVFFFRRRFLFVVFFGGRRFLFVVFFGGRRFLFVVGFFFLASFSFCRRLFWRPSFSFCRRLFWRPSFSFCRRFFWRPSFSSCRRFFWRPSFSSC